MQAKSRLAYGTGKDEESGRENCVRRLNGECEIQEASFFVLEM